MLIKILGYMILVGLSACFAILYNTYIMGIIFLLICTIPIVLMLLLIYTSKGIKAEFVSEKRIFTGEEAAIVSLHFVNPTILPIRRMFVSMTILHRYEEKEKEEKLIVSLDSLSEQTLRIELHAGCCGNITIALNHIKLFDMIELFRLKKKLKIIEAITILPAKLKEEDLKFQENSNDSMNHESFSLLKPGDDVSEVFSIREYKQGDRMNQTHWKLSQKKDMRMVKEFSLPMDCSVALFIELFQPQVRSNLESLNEMLKIFYSISLQLIMNGQQHYLIWYDAEHDLCVRKNIIDEEDLYEALGELFEERLYPQPGMVFQYHEAEFFREQYTNIFYFSSKFIRAELEKLERVRKNALCTIFLIHEDDLQENIKGFDFPGITIMEV